MRIDMHTRGFTLSETLRAYAERKLSYALREDNTRVRRVELKIEDVNGPRGGVDKRCRIHVVLNGRPGLVVDAAAIDRASEQVGRSVERVRDRAIVRRALTRPALADPYSI